MEQYALGIDLGGTNIKGVLANDAGGIGLEEVSTGADGGVGRRSQPHRGVVRDLKADFGILRNTPWNWGAGNDGL